MATAPWIVSDELWGLVEPPSPSDMQELTRTHTIFRTL